MAARAARLRDHVLRRERLHRRQRRRPNHQRARRGRRARGALSRTPWPCKVRAGRRGGRRARRHARVREAGREADRLRRGARDDADRDRRSAGPRVRAARLGGLVAARTALPGGRVRPGGRSRTRAARGTIPSTRASTTTSPVPRRSPAVAPMRSSICATPSSARSASASSPRTTRTSTRSARSPPSRSWSAANRGQVGEPAAPPALIGVPRFELGTSPTRTERATRLRHTPSSHRLAADKAPRSRRRTQPGARRSAGARSRRSPAEARPAAGRTRTRHSTGSWLSRAPQSTSAGQRTRSRSGRTSSRTSAFAALTVSVCHAGPERNASTTSGGSAGGSEAPQRPKTSLFRNAERVPGPGAVRSSARLEDPGDRQRVAGAARGRRDPGGGGQHERAHRLGPSNREPQGDRAAQGVPDDRGRRGAFALEQQAEQVGVRVEGRRGRKRRRPAVAGQLRHDQPSPRQQQRRERKPVGGRAPSPWTSSERVALACDEVAQPAPRASRAVPRTRADP